MLRHIAAYCGCAASCRIYRNTGFEGQVIATLSLKTAISNFCPVFARCMVFAATCGENDATCRTAAQRIRYMNEPRVYLHVTSGQKLLLAV